MSDQDDVLHSASKGGLTATAAVVEAMPAHVGPATGAEFNRIRAALIPIACLRLDDVRFKFASSFVRPEAREEFVALAKLIKTHRNEALPPDLQHPPISIFGHADPVGNDDYNKRLSGRRAEAVFAVLTRDTAKWQQLFNGPIGNDVWGQDAIDTMRQALAPNAPAGHTALFAAYMDFLCTGDDGSVLKLEPREFLAKGADAKGKGDFQGCGEFNPVLIFSKDEANAFAQDPDKTDRDDQNAPNRRVIVFLFQPGTRITASKWPCPRASEGTGGCIARFWSDGEKRRSNQAVRRRFELTRDTFACRFYHRMATLSPCERTLKEYQIRLFDQVANPLPFAPFRVFDGRKVTLGRVLDDAFITILDLKVPATVTVKWSRPQPGDNADTPPPTEDTVFEFQMDVFVDIDDDDSDQASLQRLHNLGYVGGQTPANDIRDFQRDYKLGVNGTLDAPTKAKLLDVHTACEPVSKA